MPNKTTPVVPKKKVPPQEGSRPTGRLGELPFCVDPMMGEIVAEMVGATARFPKREARKNRGRRSVPPKQINYAAQLVGWILTRNSDGVWMGRTTKRSQNKQMTRRHAVLPKTRRRRQKGGKFDLQQMLEKTDISLARVSVPGTRHAFAETTQAWRFGYQSIGQDCQTKQHSLFAQISLYTSFTP